MKPEKMKRMKALCQELSSLVAEMDGGEAEEVAAVDEDEAEDDGGGSDSTAVQTLKAKMMKYRA